MSGSGSISRRHIFKASAGAAVLVGTGTAGASAAPAASAASPAVARPPRDPETERRVRALLAKMTVEEKFGQLQQLTWHADTGPGDGQNKECAELAAKGLLGSVLNLTGAKKCNDLQRAAVERSRLAIPLLFGQDVIHGYLTTFPIPLAQGSSFDPEVVASDAETSAREAASQGIHWTFAPMADVSREPRWGRVAEGSGEDPYLTAQLTAAKVRGYQGADYGATDRLAACAKHFVGYGFPEGGRDYNTADVSERRLRDVCLPPFKAAVDAGVATVMASFNTVNGVPAHANRHTLHDILHEEFGFDGFVVGDYTGVQELIAHGIAADGADAARLALGAGVDMEMVSTTYAQHGKRLLAAGKISRERLDDAVARVLRVKFRAGLFAHPYADEAAEITEPSAAARSAARTAAARSMVLLRNEKKTLPLSAKAGSLAVVGPLGDDTKELHGTWASIGAALFPAVSVLEGIKQAAPSATVRFARGCAVEGDDTGSFDEAVAAARAADAVVVVVGEKAAQSGEAAARSDITLPGVQAQLVAEVAATGTPVAVVVLSGRPLVLTGIADEADAILQAWHPGIEGGHAVADVLFGKVNPGGKLPATFPRSAGQLPLYYAHENTGRPFDPENKYTSKYLDIPHTPLYPFGHGLSYTTFTVSGLKLSAEVLRAKSVADGGATVRATVQVENTGASAGDEVVQLYLRDKVASVVQPVRRLVGFSRVHLKPGERRRVGFTLGRQELGFHTNDLRGEFLVEPGEFEIYAGNSSDAALKAGFTLT
ncbi:beta-glucosidase BglX [Streptomyces sp. NPDC048483]|uniref:beta-glucosidase BglX n=1 Tax=Streptomyces sp. NPDC048483 TaxID=3154927 RepID=UPI003433EDDD